MIGKLLGSYQIVAKLGEGGMGEVYRARDTKLNRDVAIKVLPESFAVDADRLARFTREAQVLASLNHPNIAAIYGVEQNAIVMELVEGEDLSDVIARGPMVIADVLPIARQIADALEVAHEQGIVHRDLKPQNIKVRADGTVKVLDFGLAKAIDPTASASGAMNSPTMTARATQMGMVIGTAAYMAPEQAKGRAVDKRADIWAFGVVLYEMLTGTRAFKGDDVTETLASVLKDPVEFNALPPSVSPRLRVLIERCVERDVKLRLRDIGEARVELTKIGDGRGELSSPAIAAPAARISMLPWTIAAVATVLLGSTLVWTLFLRAAPTSATPAMKVAVPLGQLPAVHMFVGPSLAISRDGMTIVYTSADPNAKLGQPPSLVVRRLDQDEPTVIRGASGTFPFFSPDGTQVGFLGLDGTLKIVSIDGGAPATITSTADLRGASWGDDGFIVYAPTSEDGLWRVKASAGATPERLTQLDTGKHEKTHRMPDVLPNSKGVLFMIGSNLTDSWDDAEIAVVPARGGTPKVVVQGGMLPRYAAGHLLYFHGNDLLAAPFSLDTLEVTGPAVSVASDVSSTTQNAIADVAVSASALAYYPGKDVGITYSLVEADRAGTIRKLSSSKPYFSAKWLPDHARMLVTIDTGNTSAWMLDTRRDSFTRLTYQFDTGGAIWDRATGAPIYAGVGQLLTGSANGGALQPFFDTKSVMIDYDVSPDGQFIAYETLNAPNERIWMYSKATGQATPWTSDHINAHWPRFSPDGKWVAYFAFEGNVPWLFVRSAHGAEPPVKISSVPGMSPLWGAGGRELFFRGQTDIWSVKITLSGNGGDAGPPQRLFPVQGNSRLMDVAPDGQHLLFMQQETTPVPSSITYFAGWLDALKKKR